MTNCCNTILEMLVRVGLPQITANAQTRQNSMMNRFWSKSLVTLAARGLFATMAQADLAEFNAINAAARAARERGDNAALLTNMRKLAALAPGHPSFQIAPGAGLALEGDGAGAVAAISS
jgi:hypothetical protein